MGFLLFIWFPVPLLAFIYNLISTSYSNLKLKYEKMSGVIIIWTCRALQSMGNYWQLIIQHLQHPTTRERSLILEQLWHIWLKKLMTLLLKRWVYLSLWHYWKMEIDTWNLSSLFKLKNNPWWFVYFVFFLLVEIVLLDFGFGSMIRFRVVV